MIDLKEFKQSVLQKAMQGKLTKQLPSDGDAEDLLVKIANKKRDLVQKGKLKGYSKPLPPVTDKEKPSFKIPDNWEWTKIGNLCLMNFGGKTPSKRNTSNWNKHGIPWLSVKDINNKYKSDSKEHISKRAKPLARIIPSYSFIAVVRMAIGKYTINTRPLAINQDLRALILPKKILPWFSYSYSSLNFKGKGATVKGITKKKLLNKVIPLPPLSEQKRIVAKVHKCFELADTIQKERELNKKFAHNMKQSLLMEAMRGKLTKQLPSDGTADELLQKIQQKKQALIKASKIRRHKKLPPISKDEIPFKIPKNWKWVKLGNISNYIQRGKSPRYGKDGIPVISQKCVRWNKIELSKAKIIQKSSLTKYQKIRFLQSYDLLWNSTGTGTIGRATLVSPNLLKEHNKLVVDGHVTIVRLNTVSPKFLYLFIISDIVQSKISNMASGSTKQIELGKKAIENLLVPLPPLAEQQRIINKFNIMFSEL